MTSDFLRYSKDWFAVLKKRKDLEDFKGLKLYAKFIFAWLSINFLGKHVYSQNHDRVADEEKMIHAILKEVNSKNPNFIETFFRKYKNKINKLANLRVKRVKTGSYQASDRLLDVLSDENNYLEKLKRVVSVICVIRHNLFHADKSWTKIRDTEIIESAVLILPDLVQNLLQYYK